MTDAGLARFAEIAIADVDRVLASVAATQATLSDTDERLNSMRTGFVALKESLDRGATPSPKALSLDQRRQRVRT